jgi:pantetheine-phosphate adenylyltransferase
MTPVRRAVCPGSYDPVTNGHVDVITRAAGLFDEVVVAVAAFSTRKQPLFDAEERQAFIRDATAHLDNVVVEPFSTLLAHYARDRGAVAVVKGLRGLGDFDYEHQMSQINAQQAPQVESVYVMSAPQYSALSSTWVKEIATFGGDISALVPEAVARRLQEVLAR